MRKHTFITILALILVAALAAAMFTACGGQGEPQGDPQPNDPSPAPEPEPEPDTPQVVTLIEDIDTDGMPDMPLNIESITLYEDGTVRVVPTGDLLANYEGSDALIDGGLYPFEYIDKVKEIYLVRFGNAGFRTLIALMSDGSLFALDGQELIFSHKISVNGDIAGINTFVGVEQIKDESAFGVIGIAENGDEILLDPYLN